MDIQEYIEDLQRRLKDAEMACEEKEELLREAKADIEILLRQNVLAERRIKRLEVRYDALSSKLSHTRYKFQKFKNKHKDTTP